MMKLNRIFCRLFMLLTVYLTATMAQAGSPLQRYIVGLSPNSAAPAQVAEQIALAHGGQVGYLYEHAMRGFSISLPEAAARRLALRADIAFIEADLAMSIVAQDMPTGIVRSFAAGNSNLDIDGVDDYYIDVDVAVLDTGIDVDHPDLNVVGGANCLQSNDKGAAWMRTYHCDSTVSADDDHYHGTHVAGTIAAIDNGLGVVGIAPGARLWALKVLDARGSGYTSGIVAAIDWVVARGDIEVINMSLGGSGISEAYKTAIDNAVASGVVVVVAAGNDSADAKDYSPAYVPSAITVSALADFDGIAGGSGSATCRADEDDTLANFSNYGSVIDIAAPGVCILSTYPLEQGSYNTISGTSMAAPHVAGAAALLASGAGKPLNGNDVNAIRDTLVGQGNYDWSDESPDKILEPLLDLSDTSVFSPALVAADVVQNLPPVANFDYSCSALSCSFDGSASYDNDGTIVSYQWLFGDGQSASGASVQVTYALADSYSVSLTVTDDQNASAVTTQNVSVSDGVSSGISLSASPYKVKGVQHVDLSWQGAQSANVEVYRDGVLLTTVSNSGSYTDALNTKGGGSYMYQVCETGGSTCSDTVNAVF